MGVLRFYVVAAMVCCLTILGGRNHVTSNPVTTESDPTELPSTETANMSDSTVTIITKKPFSTPEQRIYTGDTDPGQIPEPKQGIWSFTSKRGITCIVATFAGQLNITPLYRKELIPSENFIINLPRSAAVVDGSCDSENQWMKLSWPVRHDTTNVRYNSLVLSYHAKGPYMYSLKQMNLTLQPDLFPASLEIMDPVWFIHGEEWVLPIRTSFRCRSPQPISLWSELLIRAEFRMSQLQEEAFRNVSSEIFSSEFDCSLHEKVVAIVGGCLLVFTVIAVVNRLMCRYMFRQRTPNMSYDSVAKAPMTPF